MIGQHLVNDGQQSVCGEGEVTIGRVFFSDPLVISEKCFSLLKSGKKFSSPFGFVF
jgi:hypothetical protein